MRNVFRLAIVDPDDQSREQLKNILLSMDVVWLEAECGKYEFFADVVEQTHPEIGIVSLDNNVEQALKLIDSLRVNAPDCSILVISEEDDGQLILNSMRAGAKEFLTRPVRGEDLAAALQRVGAAKGASNDGQVRGSSVIAVAGATGGVGTTSVAVNVACTLANQDRNSVALVDLDLALGDADVFLDSIPDYTLVDVAQNISRLDFALLKRSLTKHSSGLYLLPRPVQLQDTACITPDSLHRVIVLLKATFSHLVLDISKSYTAVDMVALEAASQVVLVTQLNLPCLRNVVRLLSSFEAIEGLKDKIRIVVNRVGLGNGEISLKKAKETIGREIFAQLPNDYRVMIEMRNNGVPLIEQSPKAQITQAVNELADSLVGAKQTEAPIAAAPGLSKWLSFWPRGTKSESS